MATGTKKADASAARTNGFKVSFVAVRTVKGDVEIKAVSESSDPALDFHAWLKKNKGRDESGKPLYTAAALFLRPKSNRRLHFA